MPVRIRTAIPLLGAWFLLAVGSASPRAVIPEGIPSPSGLATVAQSSTGPEAAGTEWPMLAANPQRTSCGVGRGPGRRHPGVVSADRAVHQLQDSGDRGRGKLFISTARGLYCLNAENGEVLWVYPTEMPLGHSPTYY